MSPYVPHTFYTIYIASTPEAIWAALISPEFTRQYFFGHAIEIEPKAGGKFLMRMADGKPGVSGEVVTWEPPHKLVITWNVDSMPGIDLPASLVTYEIAQAGDAVKLSLTEAHIEPIDERLLSGGRQGWPAILSSLKSLIETGKPLAVKMGPPKELLEAIEEMKRKG